MKEDNNKLFICSFCKRPKNQVKKLIAGENISGKLTFICDICVNICSDVLKRETRTDYSLNTTIMTPQEIYNALDQVVEGQTQAKKKLATIAYNHLKRINFFSTDDKIDKTNILMIGKSGCGKTLLIETLSKLLNVPFVSVDATTITATGYVGADVTICLEYLYNAAKGDITAAQRGIVFIDEIDKIPSNKESGSTTRDINGSDVQSGFLKILEGTQVEVQIGSNKKNTLTQETVFIDTTNILFICAGAFEELIHTVSKDIKKSTLGFVKDNQETMNYEQIMVHLKDSHLVKFGMLPEFLGRLHARIVLNELTIENLVNILVSKKHSVLQQYKTLLSIKDEATLTWTQEALWAIAKEAKESKNSQARALTGIVDAILTDAMFMIPSMPSKVEINIDLTAVQNRTVILNSKNHKKTAVLS